MGVCQCRLLRQGEHGVYLHRIAIIVVTTEHMGLARVVVTAVHIGPAVNPIRSLSSLTAHSGLQYVCELCQSLRSRGQGFGPGLGSELVQTVA